ncbi:DUF2345 domain-containing protein [Enterobacter cloacae complex sp. ECC445]|nr:DUF2345 domain-containing protein [Enterobacter cloacae complex sp. ECC445]
MKPEFDREGTEQGFGYLWLRLKASEGPVEVQAKNANMRLFAERKLTLSSASDISFAGKKRITLIGGGSYLRLEAGKIEYGTMAAYLRRVKRTMAAGAATMQLSIPLLPGQYSPLNVSASSMPSKPTTLSFRERRQWMLQK